MGRWSTGVTPAEAQCRIELKSLLRDKLIQKDRFIHSSLKWTNGNKISIQTQYTDDIKYMRLIYTNTQAYTEKETKHNYKIQLTTLPSNLGVGEVLYFVCPETNRRCRVLYKTYGSLRWKSRFAYSYPIYYRIQTSSKYDYHINRYWAINDELEYLYRKQRKTSYRGRKTALQRRIELLEKKLEYHDQLRRENAPKFVQNELWKFM